ncbi:MAG TPA: 4Fe-4S double cluster binding domain-containing protein [Ruminiclostridium sp.]
MDPIDKELKEILYQSGANLVGFANLKSVIEDGNMNFGVSVAVVISKKVIKSIHNGPNIDYYNEYHRINELLNNIVTIGAEFLVSRGYKACAQTTDFVKEFGNYRTSLPHKTVATRAGIGWIGKSALLVTKEYGSAVRISSLITDAELQCAEPINKSYCDICIACTKACPAKAISGELWNVNKDRDSFYNPLDCRKMARDLSSQNINKDITLCGKCIEICPFTRKYLSRALV